MRDGAIGVGLIGYGLGGSAFHAPLVQAEPRLRLHAVVTSRAAQVEREVAAWKAARNRAGRGVNWRFTTEDARIKLKHLYPTTQG